MIWTWSRSWRTSRTGASTRRTTWTSASTSYLWGTTYVSRPPAGEPGVRTSSVGLLRPARGSEGSRDWEEGIRVGREARPSWGVTCWRIHSTGGESGQKGECVGRWWEPEQGSWSTLECGWETRDTKTRTGRFGVGIVRDPPGTGTGECSGTVRRGSLLPGRLGRGRLVGRVGLVGRVVGPPRLVGASSPSGSSGRLEPGGDPGERRNPPSPTWDEKPGYGSPFSDLNTMSLKTLILLRNCD